jgi:uncharacterized membrane protein YraQ (UPF0718 family)
MIKHNTTRAKYQHFLLANPELNAKILVIFAVFLTVVDALYMNIKGISQQNRELCIIYSSMPRWMFLTYEYYVEFAIIVLLGVFAGVLIENHFRKIKRFFPTSQLLAFTYGSVLPICSCGVVPIIESMKERTSLRVIITFVIAAPLLNPYIVFLSFSVLGVNYAILRILASFILAVGAGILTELAARKFKISSLGKFQNSHADCNVVVRDPFLKTIRITRKLIPYILIGGTISFALEYFNPKTLIDSFSFSNDFLSMLLMMAIGIPIYVCNGADVLLLKPLLAYTDLSPGAAMVFSLTSSAVCVSSIVMLFKFLGRKLTLILLANITILCLLIGTLITFSGITLNAAGRF